MDEKILAAVIALAGSVTVALITVLGVRYTARATRKTQESIEILRSEKQDAKADRDALRDYAYEARRRLYKDCEPAIFRLIEEGEAAYYRVSTLAQLSRESRLLSNNNSWMAENGNALSTIYRLLAPMAAFASLRDKLTLFDLSIEPRIYAQYVIGKLLYSSFSDDIAIAASRSSRIRYDPGGKPLPHETGADLAVFGHQGISGELLDEAVNALLGDDNAQVRQLLSYPAFTRAYRDEQSALRAVMIKLDYLTRNLDPGRSPVLWRVLIVQVLLYWYLRQTVQITTVTFKLSELSHITDEEINFFAWSNNGLLYTKQDFAIAREYLRPKLLRADRLMRSPEGNYHDKTDRT
jgi:hypothetical protein